MTMMDMHDLQGLMLFGKLKPGIRVDLGRYDMILAFVEKKYGKEEMARFADCWMPDGEAVEPGYEDSVSHFVLASEEELEEEYA